VTAPEAARHGCRPSLRTDFLRCGGRRIARDWNVRHDGAGHVTRFEVDTEFLRRYPVQRAGGRTILELWVPAEELAEFNAHIVGGIQLVHTFP